MAPVPAKGNKGNEGERETGLPSYLLLTRGEKMRLTRNLWVQGGLANGSVGTIVAIIYDKDGSPPQLPKGIIATFEGYRGEPYLEHIPKSVVITPQTGTWTHRGKVKHCTQLPIIPSYAVTIHRLQGGNKDMIILNAGDHEFAAGLLLVGCTRTKTFNQMAFSPFPNYHRFESVNKNKEIKRRKKEEVRIASMQTATIQEYWDIISECCDIYGRDIMALGEEE